MRRRKKPEFNPKATIASFKRRAVASEGVGESKPHMPEIEEPRAVAVVSRPEAKPKIERSRPVVVLTRPKPKMEKQDPRSPATVGRDQPDPRPPAVGNREVIEIPPIPVPSGLVSGGEEEEEKGEEGGGGDFNAFSGLRESLHRPDIPHRVRRPPPPVVSGMWVDKYRPKTITQVQGHAKVKAKLKEWHDGGFTKPCLLVGDNGVGKTSLGRVFLESVGEMIHLTPTVGVGDVFEVAARSGTKGILLDDIHLLTTEERKRVIKSITHSHVPIVMTVDQSVQPKKYDNLKRVCVVVPMYKPYGNVTQDARMLLHHLQQREGFQLPKPIFDGIVADSNGDMRAVTIAAQMCSRNPTALGARDQFTSPFNATGDLLQRQPTLEQAERAMACDGLMPLFILENAPRLATMDSMAGITEALSTYEFMDRHESHELHRDASGFLAQGVVGAYRCRDYRARVGFPALLGKMSTINSRRSQFRGRGQDELSMLAAQAKTFNPRKKDYKQWLADQGLTPEEGKLLRARFE